MQTEALGPIRGSALDALAALASDTDPERALRLLAGSAALRVRDGGRPPAWLRAKAAAARARAQAHLEPTAAKRAWEEGLAMTTEQTIAYAVAGSRTGLGGNHRGRRRLTGGQTVSTATATGRW